MLSSERDDRAQQKNSLSALLNASELEAEEANEEAERLREHLRNIQESYAGLQKLAQARGLGSAVAGLMKESGLGDYLTRRVFKRLYEDAQRRRERRKEKVKENWDKMQREQAKMTESGKTEFLGGDCAFMRVRTLKTTAAGKIIRGSTRPGTRH